MKKSIFIALMLLSTSALGQDRDYQNDYSGRKQDRQEYRDEDYYRQRAYEAERRANRNSRDGGSDEGYSSDRQRRYDREMDDYYDGRR